MKRLNQNFPNSNIFQVIETNFVNILIDVYNAFLVASDGFTVCRNWRLERFAFGNGNSAKTDHVTLAARILAGFLADLPTEVPAVGAWKDPDSGTYFIDYVYTSADLSTAVNTVCATGEKCLIDLQTGIIIYPSTGILRIDARTVQNLYNTGHYGTLYHRFGMRCELDGSILHQSGR